MSKALYRKYRSKNLDEIVGQEHITAILKRAIANDKVAHAYLLTGPKGVGKTSIARILAHEINQLPYTEDTTHLDIIEIDAASNNSVEDVRDLREKVQIAPVSAKRKVYIIDEVHMLSKQAFNALLKTLEEPPAHIVFILATTDADKLPATIISRVQRFNFRPITEADATSHLEKIAKQEGIAIDEQAIKLIAQHGKGSFRDSISLLDQMQNLSDGVITHGSVMQILGLADSSMLAQLLQSYEAGDLQQTVTLLDGISAHGTPPAIIADQLIATIRHNISSNPQYLNLLDDLLEVHKSAWPEIKLLTALTKTIPTSGNKPVLKAPAKMAVAEGVAPVLSETKGDAKSADTLKSSRKANDPEKVTPTEIKSTGLSKNDTNSVAVPVHSELNTEGASAPVNNEKSADSKKQPSNKPVSVKQVDSVELDWQKFLTVIKPKAAGAFIILKTCDYTFDGKTLTIFAGKRFNKTNLYKALPDINDALNSIGVSAEIDVLDTPKPPADATTANILAMMGGGEEISA